MKTYTVQQRKVAIVLLLLTVSVLALQPNVTNADKHSTFTSTKWTHSYSHTWSYNKTWSFDNTWSYPYSCDNRNQTNTKDDHNWNWCPFFEDKNETRHNERTVTVTVTQNQPVTVTEPGTNTTITETLTQTVANTTITETQSITVANITITATTTVANTTVTVT